MSDLRNLYDEAIRRYNAGDVDGFAALHAEDAELVTPVGSFRGSEAIRRYWAYQWTAFPDLVLTIGTVVEQGDTIAAEWTFVGTNSGPLAGRGGGSQPATGHRVEIRGMELVRVHHGRIVEYHIYWDGRAIADQLSPGTA